MERVKTPEKQNFVYGSFWRAVRINLSAVAPFRGLTAIPPEGCTRAGILPGFPSPDWGNSLSNHLGHIALRILKYGSLRRQNKLWCVQNSGAFVDWQACQGGQTGLESVLHVSTRLHCWFVQLLSLDASSYCLSGSGSVVPLARLPALCKEMVISSQYGFTLDGGAFGRDSVRRFCLLRLASGSTSLSVSRQFFRTSRLHGKRREKRLQTSAWSASTDVFQNEVKSVIDVRHR
ncbi:hypothetical protein CSKR_113242 [Clonorchis sinensis]|uniref:Uncharacterized protein n=1 Tax=Clonorchis sinensis TaxID=79923 RepID=A0A3R7GPT4_CLOSI|nr:hypothetical protein CSKR_113242 [Clonorchis sinensis]